MSLCFNRQEDVLCLNEANRKRLTAKVFHKGSGEITTGSNYLLHAKIALNYVVFCVIIENLCYF